MAKILYGVMGNTYGHAIRSLAIASRMPDDDFYFIGGRRVPEVLGARYPVLDVPVLRIMHRRQRVDLPAVVGQIARRAIEIPSVVRRIRDLIDRWEPDIAFCDREFFLPLACRRAGLRCISINHSRILLGCRYPVPPTQWLSWALSVSHDRLLFDTMKEHISVSFYGLPVKDTKRDVLFPPVLRPEVKLLEPRVGEHVLVYQTSPTFRRLLEPLTRLRRPVIVYGMSGERLVEGNLTFKPFDSLGILEDLASCAYAVVNGGHNLICEALYYRKPILCFPVARLFEQFLNAFHVRELGYGEFSTSQNPTVEIFDEFESRLEAYRASIEKAETDGTDLVVQRLNEIIREELQQRGSRDKVLS